MYSRHQKKPTNKPGWIYLAGYFLLCLFSINGFTQSETISDEYQLKAAFILNFLKLSDWPDRMQGQEIYLCVSDTALFGNAMEELKHKKIDQKKIVIIEKPDQEQQSECHLYFIDRYNKSLYPTDENFSPGVLYVGEEEKFFSGRGIIVFFVENDKLRFTVNMTNLKKSGVVLQARLLRFARLVE